MVTKRDQLEWLAKNWCGWAHSRGDVFMSKDMVGAFVSMVNDAHQINFDEWQQERDKMQKKDNSWHERGEFPPAGCECEVLHHGKWIKTVIIGMSPYKSCVYSLIGSGSDYAYDGIANSRFFRPLRTEREKAIEEMNELVGDIEEYPTWRDAMAALYDAGYRKVDGK